jgi:hypothetical protein
VREICVIPDMYIRKLLQIKQLQKSLYGRLAADGTLAPKDARGFGMDLA